MRLNKAFGYIYAVSALLIPAMSAGPRGPASVKTLTSSSDAIVVGSAEVTLVHRTSSAVIHADRVLKGPVLKGSTVQVTWTRPENAFAIDTGLFSKSTAHGIFFLSRSANGSWSVLPATNGDVSWEDTYIPTPQNVSQALRDVASASLAPNSSVLDNVLLEIVIAAEAGAPVPYDLLDLFGESHSQILTAAFSRFLSNPDPFWVSVALRASILSGDPSSILTVRQNYVKLSSSAGWSQILDEIEIYYLNTEPQAIRTLGQIAADNTIGTDLRIAVAIALARMHTQQSLPYLAQLLGDQNSTLKAMAVGGLSSFANNVPIGLHEPASGPWSYRTDATIAHSAFDESLVNQRQTYYVGFWKDWWSQNQAKLSQ